MVSSFSFIKLFFILLILLLSVSIVSAEEIYNETLFWGGATQGITETLSGAGTNDADGTVNPYLISYTQDFTTYKTISEIRMDAVVRYTSGKSIAVKKAGYSTYHTQFTTVVATIDGIQIASGSIGWTDTFGTVQYWIMYDNLNRAYAATLNGVKTVALTYNTSIYDALGVSHSLGTAASSSTTFSFYSSNNYYVCCGNVIFTNSFDDTIRLTFNNNTQTFGYLNVTKYNHDVRVNITNSSGISYYDVTSVNDVSEYENIMTGLNVRLFDVAASLWTNRTLFLNDGIVFSIVPSVPGTGGSPSGQIYFDYSTAALTYPYGINVSILAANWSDLFSPVFIVGVTDSNNEMQSGFPVEFSMQTYSTSRLWTFNRIGDYNAALYSCDSICQSFRALSLGTCGYSCVTNPSVSRKLDTAILTIAQTQYTYSVTSDANSYSTGDVIRFNISNPSPNPTYFNMVLARGISGGTGEIYGLSIPANTNRYLNVTVTGNMVIGTWEGSLTTLMSDGSAISGRVAVKEFTIGMPTAGSKVSIGWDSNFVLGETNNLYYTTNQNTSTVTVNKTLPGSNASFIFSTFTAYPTDTQPKQYLMDTVGQWVARITDNGNASNTSTATITVAGISGCNKNMPDYVCWDKTTYLRGDPYVINYKITNIPVTINPFFVLRLLIYDPDDILVRNKTIAEYSLLSPAWELPLSGSDSRSFTSNAKVGKWHAVVMREGTREQSYTDGSILADSYAIVVDTTTATGGTNATSIPGTPRAIIDGWTALFGWGVNDVSRFFFALLFVTAGMFSGFMLSGKNLYGGVFGAFLPWAFFALPSVNYIPSWVTIFIAIIVALKIGWFK